jgi:hypothetical protein
VLGEEDEEEGGLELEGLVLFDDEEKGEDDEL